MIRIHHEELARRGHRLACRPRGVEAIVATWLARAQYRRELRRLQATGSYLLDDVGLSRKEAAEEACKPFWRG